MRDVRALRSARGLRFAIFERFPYFPAVFKSLDVWLPAYLKRRRVPFSDGVTHIMLCVCDHFEPFHDTRGNKAEAMSRMALWKREWPKLIDEFRDLDGCRPRHSFFYPIEQYDADILNELTEICRLSGGETEIHLHHESDTAATLKARLEKGKEDFLRHGLLNRDESGRTRYGFIHGNWALDNSHPAGRNCGVSNELAVLAESGCYADFTMPSAPHPTQTRTVNSIYYALGTTQPKSHDYGVPARVNGEMRKDLLLVQGPLGLNWEARKWGVLPRIDNADLTGANPPRPDRMRVWLELGIHVEGRPDWRFIKLHTHGAIPRNSGMFLGEPMRQFHRHLMEQYRDNDRFQLHYVSARELVNIVHAAEEGRTGNPGKFRDYRYRSHLQNGASAG
jgi:hypothetical protein